MNSALKTVFHSNHLANLVKLILVVLIGLSSSAVQAQGTQEVFGQNRVQFKEFTWQYYESENFVTYFNKGGQSLGKFASQLAETDLAEIQEILDYKALRQIEIIVYNTISDYNQTNLGANTQLFYNTGGKTTIIGNKLFVYFDGDHKEMRRQIREGVGRILLNNMIFGGNLQEIVQNAVLLNLPEWFVEGLVAYIGEEWNPDLDNKLRDAITSGSFDKFNKLTGEDARFAGHSLWYFIAENYGLANIPNLLYLIRVNRSLENGFLFVLGKSVNQTVDDWKVFYKNKYQIETLERSEPTETALLELKKRKKEGLHTIKLRPDGKQIAFGSSKDGKFKVKLQEIEGVELKGRAKKIAKGGFKSKELAVDDSQPIIAWDRKGRTLAIVYEKRARTMLMTYNVETEEKEVREIARFQRVINASFTDDSRKLVISAINKGQSDIYVYYIPNARLEQITNDFYDDLDPGFVKLGDREGILFTSNRDDDTLVNLSLDSILPVGNFDLFFYDYSSKSRKLLQVTHSSNAGEKMPMQYNDDYFSYLSDESGIRNRYAGYIDSNYSHTNTFVHFTDSVAVNPTYPLDSFQTSGLIDSVKLVDVYRDTAIVFPISNYSSNLMAQNIVPRLRKTADVFLKDGQPQVFLNRLADDPKAGEGTDLKKTGFRNYQEKDKSKKKKDKGEAQPSDPQTLENTDFYFQSSFPEGPEVTEVKPLLSQSTQASNNASRENLIAKSEFKKTRIRPYRLQFSTEYVTSQLDNSLFLNKYQNFGAQGAGNFSTPNLGGLFTLSIADLFEDYRYSGGFRIPTSFGGSEYYLSYEDNSKRLDKQLLYYFKSNRQAYDVRPIWNNPLESKIKTNIAQLTLKWPIDVIRSVRGNFSYRNEKIQFLATDIFSLDLTNQKEDWVSTKIEYVHDDSYELATNLREGLRFKIWYEAHKHFEVNFDDRIDVSFNDGFLSVVGFDFRHYLRVHRKIIWANRFAGGTSFGSEKLIYYLGGVDSWIGGSFNQDTEIDFNAGYAFETLATNMRGFSRNIRNGNTYSVLNSELRVPLFAYLINKPIRSELINNFQVVGFFDAGSAWRGLHPFDDEDRFNTTVIVDGPVTTTVNFFQNPLVAGYGWGARTLIFGYFMRFDMAWGIDTGEVLDPRYYFSLSLDF